MGTVLDKKLKPVKRKKVFALIEKFCVFRGLENGSTRICNANNEKNICVVNNCPKITR